MAKPIKIEILGDAKSVRKAFGDVESGIGGLTSKLGTIAATIGGVFAVDKLAGFAGELFSMATDIGNISSKITTVFGDQADKMNAWADSINEQFGVTAQQVELLAANTADLLKPMGFTTEEAAKMSQELVGLAPALAQWSGGQYDAAQVSEILSKAMLGEREQLKSLGISINQQEVDQRALTVAKKEGRDEVTNLDKALATQQLIFEKSTDAQAGYTAGTENLTGQMNLLKAKWAEAKEELATRLVPVLTRFGSYVIDTLVPAVRDKLGPAVTALRDKAQDLAPKIRDLAEAILPKLKAGFDTVKDAATDVYTFFQENETALQVLGATVGVLLVGAFAALAISAAAAAASMALAAAPFIAAAAIIGGLIVLVKRLYDRNEDFRNGVELLRRGIEERVWPALKRFGGWIKDDLIPTVVQVAIKIGEWIIKFTEAAAWVGEKILDIVGFVKDLPGKIKDAGSKLKDAITKPFQDAWDWVKEKFSGLADLLNPFKAIGNLNPFGRAMGGTVSTSGVYRINERGGRPGGEMVYLPTGARVAPNYAGTGQGGGDTFNIYGTNLTPGQVAREIAWTRRVGSGR